MRPILLLVLLASAGLAACQPAATPPVSGDAQAAAPAPPAPATADGGSDAAPAASDAQSALAAKLSKGMAYADVRTAALAQGWLPLVTPQCQENVGGEALICRELPELDACSGDGHCVMRFAHDAQSPRLRVDATGDALQWKATGADTVLQVSAWSFEPVAAKATGATCPAADFDGFLAAFAADDAVQAAHTAPLVRVKQSWDVGEDTKTFDSFETAADYTGFRMDHKADGFHVVDADGRSDATPTALDVKPGKGGGYDVSYRYGMSEGNAYRFEKAGDCWTLVGDPQAPSP